MNSLKIPEGGVMLKGSPGEDSDPLPQQAFTLSLSDSVIEGMIQCVQDGGDIQLALGAQPVSAGNRNNGFVVAHLMCAGKRRTTFDLESVDTCQHPPTTNSCFQPPQQCQKQQR